MGAADRRFELLDRRTIYAGRIVTLAIERFRFADGDVVEREVVHHQGAVGALAHDDTHLVLVRQPREAVGDPDVLEIPRGAWTRRARPRSRPPSASWPRRSGCRPPPGSPSRRSPRASA